MENVRHVLVGTCKQAVYLYWWGVSECPAELCSLYMFSLYFGVVKCHCCDVALFSEMVLMNIQKILMKVAKRLVLVPSTGLCCCSFWSSVRMEMYKRLSHVVDGELLSTTFALDCQVGFHLYGGPNPLVF